MKRRDFLASMGAAGAALSFPSFLSGCGSSGSGSGGSNNVTINWWHIDTTDPGKSMFQNLANQFTHAHPNVKITITILENDAFKQKLATVMQSGSPPDLFTSWGGGVLLQYAKSGLVKDISSSLQGAWGDSFNASALATFGQNGHYYGAPTDMGAVVLWYNTALFNKAGIAQPPGTWTQLLDTVRTLKKAGITPFALGEKDKWPGHYWWAYLAVRIGGKAAFDKAYNRTGSFADPPFVAAGQHLQEFVALDPFQPGFLGAPYTDEQTIMGNGKAAMELMGQWAPANDATSADDKKGPNLAFAPFPVVEGGAGNPTDVFGGGGGFAVGKNAPPETVDFLKFLTSMPVVESLAKAGVELPVIKGASKFIPDPRQQEIVKLVGNAPYFQLYYDQYMPPAIAQAILDATQGIFAKTTTPQAAAQAIESVAATALQ
jgi:raffinose/stachyose/melibiose transport system substrate-binding protein